MNPSTPSEPRVLVASSDHKLKLLLGRILRRLRCTAALADSAPEATTILLGPNRPEIVLLDSALPESGALGLGIEIKRRPALKRVWIMLLSRDADPATITAAAQAGVDDLFLYPLRHSAEEACHQHDLEAALDADLRIRLAVAARVQEARSHFGGSAYAIGSQLSHDDLTDLWTRESLLSMLFPETDRAQRMGTPLAFLLLDLDRFAAVNQEYGYKAGDKILRELGNRLRRFMRSYDLIGRSGSDEFLIALPGCNSIQALHLAGRIRTSLLQRPFATGCDLINLSASIGIANSRGRSPLVVLREAEQALAGAKRDGRNCEREYPAVRRDRERISIGSSLRPSPGL